ncbi:MAG: glycosyltransferase family 4 protein [Bacteroidetes bacterium]|nr:glycosyltransferase family 4 protein [Bacteroidota bacterium]MCW5894550.1 glycosyltransferase family 4 protein [Bacteroidota bacterium]
MKLLQILPSTQRGGNEEYALTIAAAAMKRQFQVHAAFPFLEATRSLRDDCERLDVRYHPLDIEEKFVRTMPNIRVLGAHYVRTLILLMRIRPDVVQLGLPWPEWGLGSMLACRTLRIRTAVVFQLVPSRLNFEELKLRRYQWALSRFLHCVSVSENNRMLLSQSFNIPREKIFRIYNGTKPASAKQSASQTNLAVRAEVRADLGLNNTARLLLTVGRLSRQKGYDILVPVIRDIARKFPEVYFVWAGEGEERENLVRSLEVEGIRDRVLLPGHRKDVSRLMQASDIFVFPTRFEGHPFALLEAMASGLPVVTSDASGITEIVEHEVHGIVFRAGDGLHLETAICRALEHPAEMNQYAVHAAERARLFSEETMVNETLDLLQNLASTN